MLINKQLSRPFKNFFIKYYWQYLLYCFILTLNGYLKYAIACLIFCHLVVKNFSQLLEIKGSSERDLQLEMSRSDFFLIAVFKVPEFTRQDTSTAL